MSVPSITVDELAAAMSNLDAQPTVIDVRELWEWAQGHLEHARHIPMSTVPDQLANLPTVSPVYVICEVGARSARVVGFLVAQGIAAHNVTGGMAQWRAQGLPVVGEA